MDPSLLPGGTCSCTCPCCGTPSSSFPRSIRRRIDDQKQPLLSSDDVNARVEIENEVAALREALTSHQKSIQELYEELEEERSAASTAASEAMSMILRVQREKAEAQMEFRQFKRFAEERMAHDQEMILALEDLLYKRDQAMEGPTTFSEPQTPDNNNNANVAGPFDYPQLKCKIRNDFDNEDVAADLEKYAFGETPKDRIRNIERRISRMESIRNIGEMPIPTPRKPQHWRKVSAEEFPEKDDIGNDRVYTVHCAPESFMSTPREFGKEEDGMSKKGLFGGGRGVEEQEEEIKRLQARLHALEVDRETMRRMLLSMGTDKAQLVILKEIAHQLCKEKMPQTPLQKKMAKKSSFKKKNASMVCAMKVTV